MPPEFSQSKLLNIYLQQHPTARDKAVSKRTLQAGAIIVCVPALSTVLLPSEKGRRCDHCFRSQIGSTQLRKCSGCTAYWYCGVTCQNMNWKAHHKKICKAYNQYIASGHYQQLQPHEKLDAILLSHLAAEILPVPVAGFPKDEGTPFSTFMSLLLGPLSNIKAPPICSIDNNAESADILDSVYSRFGNNNFAIHSHLISFAHGIFPLASRMFNHSCAPNAAARYILTPAKPVRMEIVALREIAKGEEICIPYLDPALSQTRQQILELTYGFHCVCPSCYFIRRIGPIPDPPADLARRSEVETQLRRFIFHDDDLGIISLPGEPLSYESIPSSLYSFFCESYLADLSEKFSKTSHDGSYDIALDVGMTLLALYALIYPPNYPQLGMHLLEMAKTAWNAVVTSSTGDGYAAVAEKKHLEQARSYLSSSRDVLAIFGSEGDPGGPLDEVATLERLLDTK